MLITYTPYLMGGVKFTKKFIAGSIVFQAVEDQVKQVIINLIQNTSDSISEIGGHIILTTDKDEIHLTLTVQDNGQGISEKNIKSLFNPFYTTKGINDSGLGLSIRHGIIKSHGGNITVQSKAGEGSTFPITLPIQGNLSK